MKLLGMILPLLLIKPDVEQFATLRSAAPKVARSGVFESLDPIATVLGYSVKDIAVALVKAYEDLQSIKKVDTLVDIANAQRHAEQLAIRIFDGIKITQEGKNILLPNITLPLLPVSNTPFQHLVCDVLADQTLTGVSAIHAEPGVGKSVAGALAILQWSQANPKHITVLVRGSLKYLRDFFRVEDEADASIVAGHLFPILCGKGIRLQIIFDNVFDKELGIRGELLMGLARASHTYGHVIVVSQSRQVATDVANLNGARTRMAPQQRDILEYRWDEPMTRQLILCLNATARVPNQMESNSRTTRLWERILRFFGRNPVFAGNSWNQNETKSALEAAQKELVEEDVRKILEATKFPDKAGGWKPTDIQEFLLSGKRPTLPVQVVGAGRA